MTGEWMSIATRSKRRLAVLVPLVGAVALTAAAVAFAYSGPATLTHPTGNHTSCQDFGYGSTGVFAAQGLNGTYDKDNNGATMPVTVTISNYQAGVGQNPATFDWSSTAPIQAAFVKAGSNSAAQNLYTYAPAAPSDQGLESPMPTISHVLFCFSPTAVTLRAFSAKTTSRGVLLRWHTGAEVRNLGFNVYRQVGSRRVRVNTSLVSATGSTAGSTYTLVDRTAARVATRYWLQSVSLRGSRSWMASALAG